MPQLPLLPSRARPIRARLSTPTAHHAGDDTSTLLTSVRVQFDPADGWPLAALWLPMAQDRDPDESWVYLAANGQLLPQPLPSDIVGETAQPVPPRSPGEPLRNWVDLHELVWPARADQALLVLLHNQTQGVGEGFIPIEWAMTSVWMQQVNAALPELLHKMLHARRNGTLNWDPRVAMVRKPIAATPSPIPSVRLAPAAPALTSWVLAVGSCAYPSQVFDVSSKDHRRNPPLTALTGPADRSLTRLAQRFDPGVSLAGGDTTWQPQAAIFTGDQVYVDATAGLFDPGFQSDALDFAYARFEGSQGWRALANAAGAFWPMFDDHELRDNWSPGQGNGELQAARERYLAHQRTPHWPALVPTQPDGSLDAAVHWPNGLPVYALDVRTHRSPRTADSLADARIMDDAQWQRLRTWLDQCTGPHQPPCFIASSSIVLPRRVRSAIEPAMALYEDAWGGFPASRDALLSELWTRRASNVILISGDEHMGCVARIRLHTDDATQAIELLAVHAPALYAPYPFANGHIEEFITEVDHFVIPQPEGRALQVTITPWFPPPEDGFALVRCTHQPGAGWQTEVRYDLGSGSVNAPSTGAAST